jgi:hypothetical protein
MDLCVNEKETTTSMVSERVTSLSSIKAMVVIWPLHLEHINGSMHVSFGNLMDFGQPKSTDMRLSVASLKKIASDPKQPKPHLLTPKPIYRQTSKACDIHRAGGRVRLG